MTKQEFHLIIGAWGEDISKVHEYIFSSSREKEVYGRALVIYPYIQKYFAKGLLNIVLASLSQILVSKKSLI